MIFSRVDLPAPFTPRMPIFTPGRNDKVMPLNTSRPPGKFFVTSFMT